MNYRDILDKKFEKKMGGTYKGEEVDDFLRTVADAFSALEKEKEEAERKLEVLADKVREYRNDEDALKDALLGAQKQGNILLAQAKEEAENLIADAKARASGMLTETKDKTDRTIKELNERVAKANADANNYSRKTVEDANQKAARIVAEANKTASELHEEIKRQTIHEQATLNRLKKEVEEFKNRILAAYKSHVEAIRELPERTKEEQEGTEANTDSAMPAAEETVAEDKQQAPFYSTTSEV